LPGDVYISNWMDIYYFVNDQSLPVNLDTPYTKDRGIAFVI